MTNTELGVGEIIPWEITSPPFGVKLCYDRPSGGLSGRLMRPDGWCSIAPVIRGLFPLIITYNSGSFAAGLPSLSPDKGGELDKHAFVA